MPWTSVSADSVSPLGTQLLALSTEHLAVVYQNTLTLLNSDLLLATGALSIAAVHSHTMRTATSGCFYLSLIVCAASAFLLVQCCEYLHLY